MRLLHLRKPIICFVIALAMLPLVHTERTYAISDQIIIKLTNTERSAGDLPALRWNGALSQSALLKAKDMCEKGYWAHIAPDGTEPWKLFKSAGYSYTAAGENLAKGFSSDESTVSGWMASPSHRKNIMNSEFIDIGVASLSCNFQGKDETIIVAHYGSPKPSQKKTNAQKSPETTTKPAITPTAAVNTPQPAISHDVPKSELGQNLWNLYINRAFIYGLLAPRTTSA